MNTLDIRLHCQVCHLAIILEGYDIAGQPWARCPNPSNQAPHVLRPNERATFEADFPPERRAETAGA